MFKLRVKRLARTPVVASGPGSLDARPGRLDASPHDLPRRAQAGHVCGRLLLGVEAAFREIEGVLRTTVGYAGGTTPNLGPAALWLPRNRIARLEVGGFEVIDLPAFDSNRHTQTGHRSATQRCAVAVRWMSAVVFVAFGAGKFVDHGSELASFRHYALPAPGVVVYVIGLLEITGGLSLASGFFIKAAALALAIDMVGAIVVSGIGRGETISLTLAPALLVGMIFLLRAGSGRPRDRRLPWARPAAGKRRVA